MRLLFTAVQFSYYQQQQKSENVNHLYIYMYSFAIALHNQSKQFLFLHPELYKHIIIIYLVLQTKIEFYIFFSSF